MPRPCCRAWHTRGYSGSGGPDSPEVLCFKTVFPHSEEATRIETHLEAVLVTAEEGARPSGVGVLLQASGWAPTGAKGSVLFCVSCKSRTEHVAPRQEELSTVPWGRAPPKIPERISITVK